MGKDPISSFKKYKISKGLPDISHYNSLKNDVLLVQTKKNTEQK